MKCPICGEKIKSNVKYCPFCGARIHAMHLDESQKPPAKDIVKEAEFKQAGNKKQNFSFKTAKKPEKKKSSNSKVFIAAGLILFLLLSFTFLQDSPESDIVKSSISASEEAVSLPTEEISETALPKVSVSEEHLIIPPEEKPKSEESTSESASASPKKSAILASEAPSDVPAVKKEAEVSQKTSFDYNLVPQYSGRPYTVVNNNKPYFDTSSLSAVSTESYSPLDNYQRCGTAYACIGKDIMPTEERGQIGQVKPTGWIMKKYDCVDGKYLYNRCHLIGYQLTGENANTRNLITGTRYLNMEGMLPFENMTADYVKETGSHVAYRVTPVFIGDELLSRGVLMEGYSIEDEGEGIEFCVFAYNVQPGISLDYATGDSCLTDTPASKQETVHPQKPAASKQESTAAPAVSSKSTPSQSDKENLVWIPTNGGKKYHTNPGCSNMQDPKQVTLEEAKSLGFTPCKRCH